MTISQSLCIDGDLFRPCQLLHCSRFYIANYIRCGSSIINPSRLKRNTYRFNTPVPWSWHFKSRRRRRRFEHGRIPGESLRLLPSRLPSLGKSITRRSTRNALAGDQREGSGPTACPLWSPVVPCFPRFSTSYCIFWICMTLCFPHIVVAVFAM
jgi:hypothetical protein